MYIFFVKFKKPADITSYTSAKLKCRTFSAGTAAAKMSYNRTYKYKRCKWNRYFFIISYWRNNTVRPLVFKHFTRFVHCHDYNTAYRKKQYKPIVHCKNNIRIIYTHMKQRADAPTNHSDYYWNQRPFQKRNNVIWRRFHFFNRYILYHIYLPVSFYNILNYIILRRFFQHIYILNITNKIFEYNFHQCTKY